MGRTVEMDEVCERIAEMSTASEADTKAVMTALGKVLGSLMNTGRTVHIEGLGYFYYGCVAEGNGKDNPEEVTADCITATRVRFLPERNVQQNGAVTRNLVGKQPRGQGRVLGRRGDHGCQSRQSRLARRRAGRRRRDGKSVGISREKSHPARQQ